VRIDLLGAVAGLAALRVSLGQRTILLTGLPLMGSPTPGGRFG
jgi:hypothetical protein